MGKRAEAKKLVKEMAEALQADIDSEPLRDADSILAEHARREGQSGGAR